MRSREFRLGSRLAAQPKALSSVAGDEDWLGCDKAKPLGAVLRGD
jgi:hypothetical protein